MSKEKTAPQAPVLSTDLMAFLGSVISWPIQMHKQKVPGNQHKDILPENIYTHVVYSESEAISLFNSGWRKHPDDFLNIAGTLVDAQMRKQIDQAKIAGIDARLSALAADLPLLSTDDTKGREMIQSEIDNLRIAKAELEASLGV